MSSKFAYHTGIDQKKNIIKLKIIIYSFGNFGNCFSLIIPLQEIVGKIFQTDIAEHALVGCFLILFVSDHLA